MENLLWNTLSKFVRSKYLFNLQNGNKKVLATELFLIYINEKMYFKSLKSLDIGPDRHKSKKHVCYVKCT